MVTSLLLYESIRTTKKRAAVVQPLVERLITIAKTKKPYLAIRAINQVVTHKNASRKMMEVIVKRFAKRSSGYTRIVPLGSRQGDGAKLVVLSLLEGEAVEAPAKKAPVKRAKGMKAPKTAKTSSAS